MPQGILELDSYRLAQYSLQSPCYICDAGNAHDADRCRSCFAPLALAHQAASAAAEPHLIGVIGPSGVGKSVYLGTLLDLLARHPDRLKLTARGAFSLSLQQATMSALSHNEFPAPTPANPGEWPWVHAQLQSNRTRRPTELILSDFPGECLWQEMDHANHYPGIRGFLSKSSGAFVFLDAARITAAGRDLDYATLKLLTYLNELIPDPRHGWCRRPVAFVFTKADQCENVFANPAAFAERYAPSLARHCHEHLRRFKFFAVSVAAGCAYRVHPREGRVRFPLRIEPRGILEPLEWLLENL